MVSLKIFVTNLYLIRESERLFLAKKNFGEPYPCKQRTASPRLRTLFTTSREAGSNLGS